MTNTALRDAIAANLSGMFYGSEAAAQRNADAVLAMPEMQAIRGYIRQGIGGFLPEWQRAHLESRRLPVSVVEWVMSE